jgi:hypothetical protein
MAKMTVIFFDIVGVGGDYGYCLAVIVTCVVLCYNAIWPQSSVPKLFL